ncbi:MAG TPA: hypothetical protein VJY39_14940 [Acidisphaera sp.]|nr:hypothetical protein [Acidisphaera sp.]
MVCTAGFLSVAGSALAGQSGGADVASGVRLAKLPWVFWLWTHKTTTAEAFAGAFGTQRFVAETDFADPKALKDRVVGVSTRFRRFAAPSDAIFGRAATILVTGVLADFFRAEKDVILAPRVEGTRPLAIDGRDVTVPWGEYLGDWTCAEAGCADFWRD